MSEPDVTPNSPPPTEPPPPAETLIGTPPKSESAPAVEASPVTLSDIKMPEGMTLDEGLGTKLVDIINGDLSPSARAQALVDLQTATMQEAAAKLSEQWVEMQNTELAAIKADPAFAGEKLTAATTRVSQLLDSHGSPELRQAITERGIGNNIHLLRFLDKIAVEFTEGRPTPAQPASQPKTLAERIYGAS